MKVNKKFSTIAKFTIPIVAGVAIIAGTIEKFGLEKSAQILSTPLTILVSTATYIANEKSKHLQYVEGKIKDFENQPETITVRKMLNTELQCVELFPFLEEPTNRYVIVEDSEWATALLECKCNDYLKKQHESIDKEKPFYQQKPAIRAAIRDKYNRFLNHLQEFEKMIESGAVSEEMLSNYLDPWFEFIKNVSDSKEDFVEHPINKRKYTHKQALLEYIGLVEDKELSIIQKNVRALIQRYRTFEEI